MTDSLESSIPPDICLLLRADAEQHWLHREVIPVLQDVETAERLAQEEVAAALAYLEATWNEAMLRARETDAAHIHLCSPEHAREALAEPASRYHAAVRALRGILADRVTPFVDTGLDFVERQPESQSTLRLQDKRSNGCTPRAA